VTGTRRRTATSPALFRLTVDGLSTAVPTPDLPGDGITSCGPVAVLMCGACQFSGHRLPAAAVAALVTVHDTLHHRGARTAYALPMPDSSPSGRRWGSGMPP
jgi:hypothetical protein